MLPYSKSAILSLILVLTVWACARKTQPESAAIPIQNSAQLVGLMKTQCYGCHQPNSEKVTSRIAPSMQDVRMAYLQQGEKKVNREKFVSDFVQFLTKPTAQNSRMPDAVKKYGIMPKMGVSTANLNDLAHYLYDTEIETPAWNAAANERPSTAAPMTYAEKGLAMALSTKVVLGKNLMAAIQQQGTEGAIGFCNTRALPLTDSMSLVHESTLRRVSDRPRNPQNQADATELEVIEQYKAALASGQEISPVVRVSDFTVTAYYPIETNATCLQCHGKVEQFKPGVHEKILNLYPKDRATGYLENQIRGIWVVDMKK